MKEKREIHAEHLRLHISVGLVTMASIASMKSKVILVATKNEKDEKLRNDAVYKVRKYVRESMGENFV